VRWKTKATTWLPSLTPSWLLNCDFLISLCHVTFSVLDIILLQEKRRAILTIYLECFLWHFCWFFKQMLLKSNTKCFLSVFVLKVNDSWVSKWAMRAANVRYWHKVLTYVEYRPVSCVFQNIDPHPPLLPASVSSTRTKCGGTLSPGAAVRGWGVNILEDVRHWNGLLQYKPSTELGIYVLWRKCGKLPAWWNS